MTPDELLKAAIQMYDALVHAKSALAICEINAGYSTKSGKPGLFWEEGTGGGALEMCRQVVDPMERTYGASDIFRMFYRAADDLLWKDNPPIFLRTRWAVCPICGTMTGNGYPKDRPSHVGQRCADVNRSSEKCTGMLREMIWKDMEYKTPAKNRRGLADDPRQR